MILVGFDVKHVLIGAGIDSSHAFERTLESSIACKEELEETKEKLEEKREEALHKESDIFLLEEELTERQKNFLEAEKALERTEDELRECKAKKKDYQKEHANIAEEIKDITERVKGIPSEKRVCEEKIEKEQDLQILIHEKVATGEKIVSAEGNQGKLATEVESLKLASKSR